jgi:hypothetical protein
MREEGTAIPFNMKAVRQLWISEALHPTTQYNIPEDLSPPPPPHLRQQVLR